MLAILHDRGSITIAELIAAVVVSAMTMAAIYQVTYMQNQVYTVQNMLADTAALLEVAKTSIIRDLQMAGYKPVASSTFCGVGHPSGAPTCTAVTAADSTQLRIQADLDGDGATTGTNEDIIYRLDTTTRRLTRIAGVRQLVFPNIQSFTLTYLRADGTTATNAVDIREVNVTIVGRTERPDLEYTANNGFRTIRVDCAVTPRNLAP